MSIYDSREDLPAVRPTEAGYVEVGRGVFLLHVVKQHLLVHLPIYQKVLPSPPVAMPAIHFSVNELVMLRKAEIFLPSHPANPSPNLLLSLLTPVAMPVVPAYQ